MNFTKQDIAYLESFGIEIKKAKEQLQIFAKGIPSVQVLASASIGNGIEVIKEEKQQELIELYETKKEELEIIKFVPASGAATRMFQFLFQFLDDFNPKKDDLKKFLGEENNRMLSDFVTARNNFAFSNLVKKKIKELYTDYKNCTESEKTILFIKTMLGEDGLNFKNLPKGLIPFHNYKNYTATAFEEHLKEAAQYASVTKKAQLHFTISEKHLPLFKGEFDLIKDRVAAKTHTEFKIAYSFQKKETDTLAVNLDNSLFKDSKGNPVLRPSGHGALIENLNDIDSDIVFVKNIDNVVSEDNVEEVIHFKKVLAGKLLLLQEKVFSYLKKIEKDAISEDNLNEIKTFLQKELNIKEPPENIKKLTELLNKPIRVCGVVKNTGAPGGGPFWIKNSKGESSLQIVEMAQINTKNLQQQAIVNTATHFNPVDLVCGIKDYKGKKFDLTKFVDKEMGIITQKSQDGKPLKALELPGLWNGAMAAWNSVYIEVPLATFNPVKTVNDLLQKAHISG